MQFVVMMDLVGTLTLPVAIVLTIVLIVSLAQTPITSFSSATPLVLLILVLFSPAFLILITTKKWVYLGWMIVYLFALPVWNFILPVYSFWHFDDFSWGETRKVSGETKGDHHGKKDGVFDPSKVPLRRWEDYERRRIRSIRRRERKLRELGPVHTTHTIMEAEDDDAVSNYTGSDMSSIQGNPMHYFDPSKETRGKAGSGYYPSYRPQSQAPPPLPKTTPPLRENTSQGMYSPPALQQQSRPWPPQQQQQQAPPPPMQQAPTYTLQPQQQGPYYR